MIDRFRFLARRGPVTAVRSWSADALSRFEAQRIVDDLHREAERYTLVKLFGMATGVEPHLPSRTGSFTLIAHIARALEAGRLVLIEGWSLDDRPLPRTESNRKPEAQTAADALVRGALGTRDEVVFEGQRYRLVAPTTRSQISAGPGYRPVGVMEAGPLIQRMAERLPATPQERTAWAEIVALLLKPQKDSILILERWYVPGRVATAPVDDRPAETPTQIRTQIAPPRWVEIEVAYEDGSPFQGNCLVELPGGRIIQWSAGQDGVLRVENLTPGDCKVRFPELDAEVLKTA